MSFFVIFKNLVITLCKPNIVNVLLFNLPLYLSLHFSILRVLKKPEKIWKLFSRILNTQKNRKIGNKIFSRAFRIFHFFCLCVHMLFYSLFWHSGKKEKVLTIFCGKNFLKWFFSRVRSQNFIFLFFRKIKKSFIGKP